MRTMVHKLLRQHGMELTVAGSSVRALFQPLTGHLERLAQREAGPLGLEPRSRYVYIGPLKPEIREGMELAVEGKGYLVRTAQKIYGSDGPVYFWAMCVEKGQEDTWGTSC